MTAYQESLIDLYHERFRSRENPASYITFDNINELLLDYSNRESLFCKPWLDFYPDNKTGEFLTYRAEFKQALAYIIENKIHDEQITKAAQEAFSLIENLVNNIYWMLLGDFSMISFIHQVAYQLLSLNMIMFGFVNYINSTRN